MLRLLLIAPLLFVWAEAPMPTVRDAMKKLNGGPNSLHATLGKDLKDDDLDWEAIQEETAEYVKLTDVLRQNKPKKGELASWEAFVKSYNADARTLDAAAKKKDARTTAAVLKRLGDSCMTCHKAHRPR